MSFEEGSSSGVGLFGVASRSTLWKTIGGVAALLLGGQHVSASVLPAAGELATIGA